MAKRGPTSDLNRDNWDQDDEQEEAGHYSFASNEELQTRVIKKAKRTLTNTEDGEKKSAFSGFGGFGKTNKVSWNNRESDTSEKTQPNGRSQLANNSSNEGFGAPAKRLRSLSSESPSMNEQSENSEYYQYIKRLNETFLRWIQEHFEKNPFCNFTPVCKDYQEHALKIDTMFPLEQDAFPATATTEKSDPLFKIPAFPSSKPSGSFADSSADRIAKSGFTNFVKNREDSASKKLDSGDSEMSYGAGFNSNTTNTSTVSFRYKPAQTETSSGSPLGPTFSQSSAKKATDANKNVYESKNENKNEDGNENENEDGNDNENEDRKNENEVVINEDENEGINEDEQAEPDKTEKSSVSQIFNFQPKSNISSPFGNSDKKTVPFSSKAEIGDSKKFSFASSPSNPMKLGFSAAPSDKIKFSFGASPSDSTKFSFSPAAPRDSAKFGFAASPSDSTKFSSSAAALGDPAKFSFAASPSDPKKFSFSVSPNDSKKISFVASPNDSKNFSFGASANDSKNFSFGASANDSKNFSFGASPNDLKNVSFGASPNDSKNFSFGASPNDSKNFSFGASPNDSKKISIGASPIDPKKFSFGAPANKDPPKFSFSAASSDPTKFSLSAAPCDPTKFSFGAPSATSTIIEADKEDAEYIPPKNENSVVEDDAFYTKRCKIFFKKGDSYAEKGIGLLYLKPLDGKTQLLIRNDTNIGTVLLNIVLSSTIPVAKSGKNNVLLTCIPNPPLDPDNPESKETIPILIRVKTSEDADELLTKLNECKS